MAGADSPETGEGRPERVVAPPAGPARPAGSHKGTYGTVIVVGGSVTMPGAAAICARAAVRGGVGLVKVAAEAGVLGVVLGIEPGATGVVLGGGGEAGGEAADGALDVVQRADPDAKAVLAVGPGLGRSRAAASRVAAALRQRRAVVLDADGLNLLAEMGGLRPGGDACPADGSVVLTPHPGEFARLAGPLGIRHSATDPAEHPAAAAALARAHRAVVVLKGRRTVVADARGKRVYINDTGNPALSVAGSGDVLTGLIAALVAQGMEPFGAAALGVHVHGLAADRWAAAHGHAGLRAIELADGLPGALNPLRAAGEG